MDGNNGPAKPFDICHRLFNFLAKNFSFVRFKQVSQGGTGAAIPVKTSPSWKDKKSEVPVTVSKGDAEAGLLPPTVDTVAHQITSHEAAPSAKPGKKSVAIGGGSELTEEKDVKVGLGKKASMGEQGKAVKDGKMEKKPSSTGPRPKLPDPQIASDDINEKSGKFIRQQKDDWKDLR